MRHPRLFLLLWAVIFALAGLLTRQVLSGDESRVAGIAAEMALSGDWLTPRLNGRIFLEYPPGGYITMALAFKLFGINDFAAKLPAAAAMIGAVLLTFGIAKNLGWGRKIGLTAGVMLLTMPGFWSNGSNCRVDMQLAFCVTLALYGWSGNLRRSAWRNWLWFTVGIGAGFLVKGAVGALPLAVAGVWSLADDAVKRRISWGRYFGFAGALLLAALPVALYLLALESQLGAAAFHDLVLVNGLGRFSGAQGDHVAPWWFYLARLPEFLQPYLIFVLGGLIWALYRRRYRAEEVFALLAVVVPFLLFSAASAKRSIYLLPLFAPGALIAGATATRLWRYWRRRKQWRFRLTPAALAAVLLVTAAAFAGATALRERRDSSLRELFSEWEKRERSGEKLFLYRPAERTSGGAVFRLRRRVPEGSDPVGYDFAVVRDRQRRTGKNWGDKHYIIPVKELKP